MKRIIFASLALFLIFASLLPASVSAQQFTPGGKWWKPTPTEFAEKVDSPNTPETEIFGERYTFAQVNWIFNSLVYMFGGKAMGCVAQGTANIQGCLNLTASTPDSYGPIVTVASYIDILSVQRPASGVNYAAGVLHRFNVIPEAYAQTGYGFANSLLPIQLLWTAARNATYALLTIAIIILGMMIMFRAKISAQAAVSVQSALPRVVIGMIFITFSYAIAGFMVDLTFVALGLVAAIVKTVPAISGADAVAIFDTLNNTVGNVMTFALAFILDSAFGGGVIGRFTGLNTLVSGNFSQFRVFTLLTGGALDALVALVVFVILFIALLRVLWIMLRSYVVILFLVVGAPFAGILYIVSPSSSSIQSWMRSLASNLSVFVSVAIMAMMAHIIYYGMGGATAAQIGALQLPSAVTSLNPFGIKNFAGTNSPVGSFPGGFGFPSIDVLGLFVSLAVMLSLPKLASGVRDGIASGRMGGLGFDMGGVSGAYGLGMGAAGAAYNARRAPAMGAFDQQVKQALERGPGTTPLSKAIYARTMQRYQASQLGRQAEGMLKKISGMK